MQERRDIGIPKQFHSKHVITTLHLCPKIVSRLTLEHSVCYEKVKKALLTRFRFTADGFRENFLASKPEAGETGSEDVPALRSSFDRWIDLAGVACHCRRVQQEFPAAACPVAQRAKT